MPQVEEEAGLWKGEGDGSVKMSPERKVKETRRRREGSRKVSYQTLIKG